MTPLLEGTTVVDLSTVGPASRCAAMLADLGADVVKVLPPPGSGRIRPAPWAYHGGRGAREIELDLKDDDGRDAFLALAGEADVVLESFRPGVADRLGIGPDDVRAVNPGIVYAALTGYGQHGPLAGWAGHDLNYQAVAGMLACQGRGPDGGPALPGVTVADSAGGGMHAALSICAALVRRGRTGQGAVLDVAATDGCLELTSLLVDRHLATGDTPRPGEGLLTGGYACYGLYEAGDGGWLAVAAIEPEFFANLCRATGCEQWIDHQHDDAVQDQIRADLQAAFRARSRDEWAAELGPADCCVSPVLDIDEVADQEQVAARGLLDEVELDDGRVVPQLAPLLAGSRLPGAAGAGSRTGGAAADGGRDR